MLSAQRLMLIREMIERDAFVSVKEIMERFDVSRSSAMRDLIELENQGVVIRERGGAVLKERAATVSSANEVAIRAKENVNEAQKRLLCARAARTIHEGDCHICRTGARRRVFGGMDRDYACHRDYAEYVFLQKLPATFPGTIYLLGGEFGLNRDMSYGPLTIEMLKQFNFDLAFLTTNGIDLERGEASVFDFEVGQVKKEVLKRCRHSRLLVDASKIGKRALCSWARLDAFQDIYMDACPEDERLENIVICD